MDMTVRTFDIRYNFIIINLDHMYKEKIDK